MWVLIAPGAFLSALICWRWFRRLVLFTLLAVAVYTCTHPAPAHAQEADNMVVCYAGRPTMMTAKMCDLITGIKKNMMRDLREGRDDSGRMPMTAVYNTCVRTLNTLVGGDKRHTTAINDTCQYALKAAYDTVNNSRTDNGNGFGCPDGMMTVFGPGPKRCATLQSLQASGWPRG